MNIRERKEGEKERDVFEEINWKQVFEGIDNNIAFRSKRREGRERRSNETSKKGWNIERIIYAELGETDPSVKTKKWFEKFEDIRALKIELKKAFESFLSL